MFFFFFCFFSDVRFIIFFFFFSSRRRHTRLTCDWSSDVCSSDLVKLSGFDNHWLRPDINPLPQSGNGWGYQLEGIVSYDVTQNFSVGGRYWYAKTTSGTTQFPLVPP